MKSLSPDMVLYLSTFLNAKDILHAGMTCKTLSSTILENRKMWKYYVIQRFPDIPVSGIGEDDVEWKVYAFSPSSAVIRRKLQLHHLSKRFVSDPSSKDFLRFFCCISTPSAPGETDCIMTVSEDIQIANGQHYLTVKFAHAKLSSVLMWQGEKGIISKMCFYAVDRRQMINRVELFPVSYGAKNTLLSRSQYSQIGRIAYQDPNFFVSDSDNMSYNYNDSHSYFRHAFSRDTGGIGSVSKIFNRPNVAVDALTSVNCQFDLDTLFDLFCVTTSNKSE